VRCRQQVLKRSTRLRPNLCLENAGPPVCLILGGGSSVSSGIPPWEAFDGEVLGLLE
jgi:hypothetical protein